MGRTEILKGLKEQSENFQIKQITVYLRSLKMVIDLFTIRLFINRNHMIYFVCNGDIVQKIDYIFSLFS